ncbi:MAG: thymidine phosphorylase [Acidimicrobiia bacterium]|nr:thymidine phosphorylase [Acidimicrobiia bacterium]MCY4433144.1 thymidine phosphorylase [bacterium]
MNAVDLIVAKRDGDELSDEQIIWFINGVTAGTIPAEQAAALLMAIVWRSLSARELATWTAAMIESGQRLDLSSLVRPTVDKHSTGGVGDKVSLVLCPLVAACGAAVPQLSGRGLGHTGGTLDKMEAIAGWRAELSYDQFLAQLGEVGAVIAAATADLAPADRVLYALRDVTGTVASIPLIASSIMSKKIAEGTAGLVLDVKFGSGAFLPDPAMGQELARTMVGLGHAHGVDTVALLTDMDQPLGLAAGNALEVAESVEALAGGGPADLVEVTLALAREMVDLAGLDADPAEVLASGRAMDAWRAMVAAQGGDPSAPLPVASEVDQWTAPASGIIGRIDALSVGVAAWRLGAGRARKEDDVSAVAGVKLRRVHGDRVAAGDVIAELHTDDPSRLPAAHEALSSALTVTDTSPEPRRLIASRITYA